ncbi:MAG: ABC transporter permease [Xanthobacteraceae bacterium]|jgi:putative ABC transport system permease protein
MTWGKFISLSGRELRGGLRHVGEFISATAIYLRLVAKLAAAVLTGRIIAPLIFKLAARNLFHDRLRFAATITGIVFSMVLVSVQMGLFVSFRTMVTTMIDHAPADLWIMPLGTKCFEDPALLDERERFRALSVPGVAAAVPVLVSFAQWHIPSGGITPVLLIGSDRNEVGLQPWNIIAGDPYDLSIPDAVAVDRSYFERLGTTGLGDTVEIRDLRAKIRLVTQGIRSFTTTPYVFTPLDRARTYAGISPNKATYLLVRLQSGANAESVRSRLNESLAKAEALTPDAFRSRSRSFWLFGTGAGAALFAGALLGMIVGVVIVAQTLYASTKEFSNEFATLRAIGSSSGYIYTVIIMQAFLSAAVGFGIAAAIGMVIVKATADSALPVLIPPGLMASLFLLTVAMCVVSAIAAIVHIMRTDPAVVFTR